MFVPTVAIATLPVSLAEPTIMIFGNPSGEMPVDSALNVSASPLELFSIIGVISEKLTDPAVSYVGGGVDDELFGVVPKPIGLFATEPASSPSLEV